EYLFLSGNSSFVSIYIDGRDCCQTGQFSQDVADGALTFVKSRTAQINQIRGLLAEFGIVLPPDTVAISRHVPALLEDAENCLTMPFRQLSSYL
ncbi:hypothetical protein AB9B25_21775, partial [Escherichia coli]